MWIQIDRGIKTSAITRLTEMKVKYLNEILYIVSSSLLADCLRFRNRHLLVTAKLIKTKPHSNQFEWGFFLFVYSTFQIASLPFLKPT